VTSSGDDEPAQRGRSHREGDEAFVVLDNSPAALERVRPGDRGGEDLVFALR
jgi:hypothetical protein